MLKEREAAYRCIEVTPQASVFGAEIAGLDLSRPLPREVLEEVKAAWAAHGVVAFPDQPLSLEAQEAFTETMGGLGHQPLHKAEGRPPQRAGAAPRAGREGDELRRRLAFRLELPGAPAR